MDDTAPPLAPLDASEGHRDPHGVGEWLSINAAARKLGVTATAVRNRLKRGTLQWKPNGNFGKLVFVPLAMQKPVPLTPEETVPLTVTLTILQDHIETLKTALSNAEGELKLLRPEHERAERLAVEAATVPGLKVTIAALRALLETQHVRAAEAQAERERLLGRSWWRRLVNA